MKRYIILTAIVMFFAVSVRAQEVITVTRYVYVQPPQAIITKHVYVSPPAPRISIGDVIIGAAIIYGVHEAFHSHHNNQHPQLIRVPSYDTYRFNHSRPRPAPIRSHHR
jgi:hypothetical protein